MSALIEIDQLTKFFGKHKAVNSVSLQVQRGEVLGFLGPNGAGKSTTMRMITGFLSPSSGKVTIDGLSVDERIIEVRQRIGYLPEGAPLYPDMTAAQLLKFVARIRHMPRSFFNTQYDKVVAYLSLEDVLHQPIDTLSKGFKRRVGLAQAILHDPDILILDEPTDGLDPLQKQEVRRLIASMKDEKAIIISTHILEEVDAICTRAAIITHGTLRADGTPQQLRNQFKQDDLNAIFCAIAKDSTTIMGAAS
jgi:ABC-2 type transport system ATP-binding protein